MANRIKGITVEIGGDTTKLSKALEVVNKNIKNTQTQLKDVEKLLKLDPIQNHSAISVPFGWLGTVGNYVNVLHECSGISAGEYYLAWKAITDNTSPMIRAVKVVDVTI